MASNGYNPYTYQSYQQSSGQQYSGYQTAPAANQAARQQYQQAVTTQATDYMSYPAQTYGTQPNTYGGGQDNAWTASNYGGNRETTSRAAEVLQNMSNTAYNPNTTGAVSQPSFTATNAATANAARYSNASPAQQVQQPPHAHTSHSSYGQSQARPPSANTNRAQTSSSNRGLQSPAMAAGYPSQRAQNLYKQPQQRSASPAQPQYGHSNATSVSSARSTAMTAATQPNDYSHRQLPSVDSSRNAQNATPSNPYSYADTQAAAPISQTAPANNVSEQYNQGTVTVDPMAVYNPWPEYQRKQEKLRQQKAADDAALAARAEQERAIDAARQEVERRKEEERRKAEEEESARQAAQLKSKKTQPAKKATKQPTVEVGSSSSAGVAQEPDGDPLEAEIRAMMAKMRELNSKDPALLARIWEEERRTKASNLLTVHGKPTPQPAVAQPAQINVPVANQRKKTVPKEPASTAKVRFSTPVVAQTSVAKPQAQAVSTGSTRSAGNTVWPPEKKEQLAHAAATYLNGQNPNNLVTPRAILSMLNSNPSYIELCEQLEAMSLKLDRAAFAKNLLTAVPDVNSASRSQAQARPAVSQMNGSAAQRAPAPLAVTTKKDVATPVAPSPQYASVAQPLANRPSFPPFPEHNASTSHSPIPVAEMVPIKPELKPPANKEEAARKRNFNDLIDLTALSEEDDMEPVLKKQNVRSIHSYTSPGLTFDDTMDIDEGHASVNNFPVVTSAPPQPTQQIAIPSPYPQLPPDLKTRNIVQPLDKKNALRRSNYNIKTIARDVLLACGRHPEERQLNAHLEILKASLSPQVSNECDLSTLRWDIIDPGRPPKGYYRDGVQALAEDADDEDDSDEDEGGRPAPPPRASSQAIGVTDARVQALPATNPFKVKRRGRPPRHSYPDGVKPQTPQRTLSSTATNMSASAPRPSAASVGYSAFRAATEYGPDGQPLPKKKGRPVGWRKAIHGSAASQVRVQGNRDAGPSPTSKPHEGYKPLQPSTLRNVRTGEDGPITINSRSPSVANNMPKYQSFKCKWQNCQAELHNLETLKKHVHKVHRNATPMNTLECLWGDCGREVTNVNSNTSMRIERFVPFAFTDEARWREHLELRHFGPLSWELGDGPASGLSDAHESEAYLSDAQGRRVTPRVTADLSRYDEASDSTHQNVAPARGRGRPPKAPQEQEAREVQERLVAHKKRIGGPGMDRGGATFVNEKRRKGFLGDDQTEEEFVDAEE